MSATPLSPSFVEALGVEFRPLPFLGNPHVQTLLGTWLTGRSLSYAAQELQVLLADGDRLMLHDSVPPSWTPGAPIALLVHGLSGTHNSGYMRRLAGRLLPRGVRVVRLDLRGCGRGASLARGTYNAGCSDDIRAAAVELQRENPSSPLALIGFSLGGNIVLKLAGEAATNPVPGLERVVAVSPPIDLERCSVLIAQRRNRFYERHFVNSLVSQVRERRQYFPDVPEVDFPRRLTLQQFDDLYTAPRGGFANALDYYRRVAALPLVPRIQLPTFILTARDDPFIAVEPFESLAAPPNVHVEILPYGGHLGFLGWDGTGGIRWAERRIADWVTRDYPPAL
jgi:predicted alpha/beta-fold hydrolase